MPDCIQTIQGKPFRKKSYWRAISTAFGLNLRDPREELIHNGDDWGYICHLPRDCPERSLCRWRWRLHGEREARRMVTRA